jgi:hypothetical protein
MITSLNLCKKLKAFIKNTFKEHFVFFYIIYKLRQVFHYRSSDSSQSDDYDVFVLFSENKVHPLIRMI